MTSTAAAEKPAPRRRRRWPLVVAATVVTAGTLAGSVPWLLSTPPGNRLVAKSLARAFAPGRLRFESIQFSWTRPTRLSNVVLEDPAGKAVVTSPSASLSASLGGLIVRPERPGTLALGDATFDVERRADGSIDLFEALSGILADRDPDRDLTIRADGASLRLHAPALPEPVAHVVMDFLVRLRPEPGADEWGVDLRRAEGSTLRVLGEVDHRREPADLGVEVAIARWPLAIRRGGVEVRTTLDGNASARRVTGRWASKGHLKADGLLVGGKVLNDEAMDLETLVADWSIARDGAGAWSVEHLDATSPVGRLSATVPGAGGAARVEGRLELPALARKLPKSLGIEGLDAIESGIVRLAAATGQGDGWRDWTLESTVDGLAWKGGGGRIEASPFSLAGHAHYEPSARQLDVRELALTSRYGAVRASGRVDESGGTHHLDLSGSIEPAWDVLAKLLADRVEPNATLAGKPSAFRIKGPLDREALEADLGIELTRLDVFGMRLGPAPLAVHARGGRLAVDPIESTLNGGRLRVEPIVDLEAQGEPVVRLDSRSSLADAAVNEEVSRRVLSYVAPVLDQATRASGRVSVAIDEATFPVGGPEGRANVTGKVIFQDVEFAPGPLAREVVGLVAPRRELETVHLDRPVLLTIAEGRVNQKGLAIPIGDVTQVEVEGWVDFDRNLGLLATLPVTPAMFGDRPLIGAIVGGTVVRVPIGGTLDAPRLDKAAFNEEMKELGKNLLVRGAGVGAMELLDRLARPRDPDAPPPPTPEERRARRLERRNERRRARGLDPLPMGDDR